MALPRKGSQTIVVEGVTYRWKDSVAPGRGCWLLVEDDEDPGQRLILEYPYARHYSLWTTSEEIRRIERFDITRLSRALVHELILFGLQKTNLQVVENGSDGEGFFF